MNRKVSPVGTKSNSRIATSFTLPTENPCPMRGGTEFAIDKSAASPETSQVPSKKAVDAGSTMVATASDESAIPPSIERPIEFPPVTYPIC